MVGVLLESLARVPLEFNSRPPVELDVRERSLDLVAKAWVSRILPWWREYP